MKFWRKARTCRATTGSTFVQRFPCELPDDGHEWHEYERSSPPMRAKWRDKPGGGREYQSIKIG